MGEMAGCGRALPGAEGAAGARLRWFLKKTGRKKERRKREKPLGVWLRTRSGKRGRCAKRMPGIIMASGAQVFEEEESHRQIAL
jgi:hypothetical protein